VPVKNQIAAFFMIIIMSIMMVHNSVPHMHHYHALESEKTQVESHPKHQHLHHHHSHSESDDSIKEDPIWILSIFDFGEHQHTFNSDSFDDYVLSDTHKPEVRELYVLSSLYSCLGEVTYASKFIVNEYFPPRYRFPDAPPTYSFPLRGPPTLG
jgi:hypothetical protein